MEKMTNRQGSNRTFEDRNASATPCLGASPVKNSENLDPISNETPNMIAKPLSFEDPDVIIGSAQSAPFQRAPVEKWNSSDISSKVLVNSGEIPKIQVKF